MTNEKSGFWIAAEELARQPDTGWEAASWRDRKAARSSDLPF